MKPNNIYNKQFVYTGRVMHQRYEKNRSVLLRDIREERFVLHKAINGTARFFIPARQKFGWNFPFVLIDCPYKSESLFSKFVNYFQRRKPIVGRYVPVSFGNWAHKSQNRLCWFPQISVNAVQSITIRILAILYVCIA
jgi:hypothetical protein